MTGTSRTGGSAPPPSRRTKEEEAEAPSLQQEMEAVSPWLWGTGDKSVRSVKSAERTLSLFELFSLCQRPLTVGEIATALAIPQPSVSMLVRNFTMLGYLEHDRVKRTYVPTVRIMLLGSWINRRFSKEFNLDQRLERLMQRVNASVFIVIQNGIYAQYVLVQMPENPYLSVQSGLLRPITCTAPGRILLSLKSDAEIKAIARRCNAEVDAERLRIRPSRLLEIIRRARETGFAETAGDMTPNRAVIAMNIPNPSGKLPMAVGVGSNIADIDARRGEIQEALREFGTEPSGPPRP